MLSLLQLLLASLAIYSALKFEEEVRLLVPLGLLVLMFIVGRMDRRRTEQEKARKDFLKTEAGKIRQKEATATKDQHFLTIESLLWPKSELLLIDTVHSVLKELGFRITGGINYHSVDRIVRIPESQDVFGLQILRSEKEVRMEHPKITRALEVEREKREKEKTLIIASTHSHLALSEMRQADHISKELVHILIQHHITFMTTHHLYQLWQKAQGGELDIFGVFRNIYSHPGGVFSVKGI
jgi:hypothetical protein